MDIVAAGREAWSSIPEVPANDLDMLARDDEVSFKEALMPRVESLIDISDALALATWPRIGLRAVSMLVRLALIDPI
jgi:hypothetical protein